MHNPYNMDLVGPQPTSETVAKMLAEIEKIRMYEDAQTRKCWGLFGIFFFMLPICLSIIGTGVIPFLITGWVEESLGWIFPGLGSTGFWVYSLYKYLGGKKYIETHSLKRDVPFRPRLRNKTRAIKRR